MYFLTTYYESDAILYCVWNSVLELGYKKDDSKYPWIFTRGNFGFCIRGPPRREGGTVRSHKDREKRRRNKDKSRLLLHYTSSAAMRDAQPLASPCDSSAFGSQAGVLIDEDWQALVSCFEHTGLINRSSWYLLINASAVIWKAAWRAKLAFGCCQSKVWYVGGLSKAFPEGQAGCMGWYGL